MRCFECHWNITLISLILHTDTDEQAGMSTPFKHKQYFMTKSKDDEEIV